VAYFSTSTFAQGAGRMLCTSQARCFLLQSYSDATFCEGEMSEMSAEQEGVMTYSDYLRLRELLELQSPLSGTRGEMLFIIVHQITELWLKIIIDELREARHRIMMGKSGLGDSRKALSRVKIILSHLVNAWDIVATLSPQEYAKFRNLLGSASGLQSHQFVLFNLILSRDAHTVTRAGSLIMRANPEIKKELEIVCLYDELLTLIWKLYEDGDVPEGQELRTRAYSILQNLYANSDRFVAYLYEVCEDLVCIDDLLCQWRNRHIITARRLIGLSHGTGGTQGVAYLESLRGIILFKELRDARSAVST
jgi:tryptophan 2,3-dioxygenase